MTTDIKELSKKTIHNIQYQNIIISHSKLEPVEAAKSLCYTDMFTIHPASFPRTANPSPLRSPERKNLSHSSRL